MTAAQALPLVVNGSEVTAGRVLGSGGQGTVSEVLSIGGQRACDLVLKRYLPGIRINARALTRLVAWRRTLAEPDRSAVDEVACWPRSLVLEDDRVVGALLPLAPERFAFRSTLPSGAESTTLRELQFLIAAPGLLARRGISDPTAGTRLRLLARFTDAVAVLHERGVVLGDVSVKNLLWWADRAAGTGVYLLDCDSLRLDGTDPATPQPNSPGWDDPSFPGTQNRQSDVYKTALVVLRVLARDFHTRDPRAAEPLLGRDLLPLLRAGLHSNPFARPRPAVWAEPLLRRADHLEAKHSQEGSTTP